MSKLESLKQLEQFTRFDNSERIAGRVDRGSRRTTAHLEWVRKFTRRFSGWFAWVVLLPTLVTGVYYGMIASDQYISEAKFVVRSSTRSAPSGIGMFLSSVGISRAQDDTFPVNDFIASRDAAKLLVENGEFRNIINRPEADFLARQHNFYSGPSFEQLYKRYGDFVDVSFDTATSISTLRVYAFRPKDAQTVANTLLNDSEALVNSMNERARVDAVKTAQGEVQLAETRIVSVQTELTKYRTRENTLDPGKSSSGLLDLIGRLAQELASTKAQLSEFIQASPQSPQIPGLQNHIASLDRQIAEEQRKIVGNTRSIVTTIGEYEYLLLEREFAEKSLSSAIVSLESARVDAQRQQLYLERVVEPNLPDYSLYPRRLKSTGTVLLSCLLVYGIGWLLVAGVKEHTS